MKLLHAIDQCMITSADDCTLKSTVAVKVTIFDQKKLLFMSKS